jgi:ankyrin repeat protein
VIAASHGREHIVRLLLDWPQPVRADSRGGAALLLAVRGDHAGHESIVRMLLDAPLHAARADCNSRGGGALVDAARNGAESIVRLLLDRPLHAPGPRMQRTALHHAVRKGHAGVAELLLARLVPSGDAAAVYALRNAAAAESAEELAQALLALNTGGGS